MNNKDILTELIIKAQNGDLSTFNRIIEMTQPDLLRFSFMLTRNKELSLDLCQDSYISAIKKITTLKDPKQFKQWLFRILKNNFYDYKKSKKNSNHTEISNVSETVFVEDQSNLVDNLNAAEALLSQLEPQDRELVLLVYLEEFTFKEVSEITGVPENSVKTRVYRALEKIKNT